MTFEASGAERSAAVAPAAGTDGRRLAPERGRRHAPRSSHWAFGLSVVVVIDVLVWMSPKLLIYRHDRDTHQSS